MRLQFLPRAIIMVIRKVIARLSAPSRRQPRRLFSKTYCIFPGLAKFGIAPGLGPGDRGFKSRSPDQNRQFSVRKLAVLTFWKGFSLFIAAQFLTPLDGNRYFNQFHMEVLSKNLTAVSSCAFSFSWGVMRISMVIALYLYDQNSAFARGHFFHDAASA